MFNPESIQILEKGEHYTAVYPAAQGRIEVELRFTGPGRVRLIVSDGMNILEDTELRLPTTNSMSTKMHAKALIMSATVRHLENIAD
jgi:hypothetical protein